MFESVSKKKILNKKKKNSGTFSNYGNAEEDDEQAAEPVEHFCHFLSFAHPFCDQAQDGGAGESDNQVDHGGNCGLACFKCKALFSHPRQLVFSFFD